MAAKHTPRMDEHEKDLTDAEFVNDVAHRIYCTCTPEQNGLDQYHVERLREIAILHGELLAALKEARAAIGEPRCRCRDPKCQAACRVWDVTSAVIAKATKAGV